MAKKENSDEMIVVDAERYRKVKKALEASQSKGQAMVPSGADEKESTRELIVVDVKRYKKIKKELADSEERYRQLFENVPIGIYRTTPDGRIVDSNPALVKMLGYSSFVELAGRNLEKDAFEPGYDRSGFIQLLEREGEIKGLEAGWKKKDGSLIQVRENAKLIRDDNGQVFFEGTVEDITQRKLTEETQHQHTRQIEILNAIISRGNTVGSLQEILDVILDCVSEPLGLDTVAIFLLDPEGRRMKQLATRGAHKDARLDEKFMSLNNLPFAQVLRGRGVYVHHVQENLPELAGPWGWRLAASIPLVSKGRVIGALNAASCRRDIFSREEKSVLEMIGKEAGTLVSKLQTEAALRESENYYRILIETSPNFIFVINLDGALTMVNQRFLQYSGFASDEIIGRHVLEFVGHMEPGFFHNGILSLVQEKRTVQFEYPVRCKDGSTFPMEVSLSVLFAARGEPSGIMGVGRDVSERKQAEAALRDSEEKFRSITEQTSDLIAITDVTGVITFASASARSLFQFAPEEMRGHNFSEFLAASSLPTALTAFRKDQKPGIRSIGLELTAKRKDGSLFACELNGSSFHYGEQYGSLVVIRDISERKRAQLDIEEKNKDLAILNEISLELAALPPRDDLVGYISKKMMAITHAIYVGVNYYNQETRQLEFKSAETTSKRLTEANRILGKNIRNIKYDVSAAMYKEITSEIVGYRDTLYDASFGTISKKISAIVQRLFHIDRFIGMALVVDGELKGAVIMAVTKGAPPVSPELLKSISSIISVSLRRKQAENQLVTSEERFKKLFYISPDSILLSRLDNSTIVSINKGFTKIMDYQECDVIGKTTIEINLFKNPEDRFNMIAALQAEGAIENSEYWFVGKSGKDVLGLVSATIIEIDDDKYILSTVRDITERKRAEEELRFLSSITENTTDAIMATDADYRITYVNKIGEQLFGYTLDELRGKTPAILNVETEAAQIQKRIYTAITSGGTYLGESLNRHKDGSTFYCEFKVMPLRGGDGSLRGYFAVQRDISARKRSEAVLRQSEETFRRTFAAIPGAAYVWTRQGDGRIVLSQYNRAAETTTHGKIKDFLGVEVGVLYAERPDFARKIRATMSRGKRLSEEVLYAYQCTGETRWLVVDYVRTAPGHVMIITRDVSERKQAEAKLLAYQEQLRALSSELTLVEERERRRIASDLHDQIGQNLALCKLKVAALEKGKFPEKTKSELSAVRRLLECSIQDARSLIFDLSPPVLYELGFQAALEWLVEWIGEQFRVPVEFENHDVCVSLELDRQVILFQVVRELLVNVGKHAQAGRAKVILSREGSQLMIQVNDDGRGFDASRIFDPKQRQNGYGFFSMRERLNYLGGSIAVRSRPGMGSQINLTVPQKSLEAENGSKEDS